MTVNGILDTTVLIHIFRGNANAKAWLAIQNILGVTSITQLELLYGARGKTGIVDVLKLLNTFITVSLTNPDQIWAERQMIKYRLSYGVGINDTLIASVCHRLQIPIYTHNTKDMFKLLPSSLVIEPYKP
jgi:predicted nucleic acid-binding protein